MKLSLKLFISIFSLIFINTSLYATVISTETFDSNISGWNTAPDATWDGGVQKLLVQNGTTATKTYSFPSSANRLVFFTLEASEVIPGNWDNEDLVINANGVEVLRHVLDGTTTLDFNTTLDSDGNVTISINPQTNNASEDLYIDDIVIDRPVVINFSVGTYNVNEDLSSADWTWAPWPITFELSEPVAYDVEIDYVGRDDSAIGGIDFSAINAHLIIPAGDTNATRNIAIVHDPAIELIETFFIDMSNPEPTGSVILGNTSTMQVNIAAQVTAPLCYSDDFETPLDADWRTLYSSGGFTPQIVNGHLRLTSDDTDLATAVTKDFEFRSQENLIVIEFTHYAWGGCNGGGGLGADGADGIVAVLYDTAVGASPAPGGFGGSMGYAQNNTNDGFEGGWLGLGIDEYGNFANCNESRVGGIPGTSCDSNNGFNAQTYRNKVSIRGDGSGSNGYDFLAVDNVNPYDSATDVTVADKAATSPEYGHKYRMTTDARDPDHLYITLERDINDGNGYQLIINQFDAKDPQYDQSTTPDFVRFAMTAGTGGGCNNHEIDDLTVYGVCRAYGGSTPEPHGADVVNDWVDIPTYNSGTHNIRTQVAGNMASTLTGVHLDPTYGEATPYSAPNPGLTFSIIPYLTDATCSSENINVWDPTTNQQLVIDLVPGETAKDGTMIVPPHDGASIVPEAYRDRRFEMIVVDSSLLSVAGQNCILTSSTTGNFARVSQCANSETQYVTAFGQDAWDRCGLDRGRPCDSNNHGIADPTDPTFDATEDGLFQNELGCYMCTFDVQPSCSTDNFAIRPERFQVVSPDPHYSDLMRAGQNYQLQITAYNQGTTIPTDLYNQSSANIDINQTKWLNNPRVEDTGGLLAGTSTWAGAFTITNGTSLNSFFKYDDVGAITLRVEDHEWASVDSDDTPQTCDPDGAYICGENNMTFIPHHFAIEDINISNNTGTYTYFSNIIDGDLSTYNMGARIEARIVAQDLSNNITENFRDGNNFYENQVSLESSITHPTLGTANTTTIIPTMLGFGTGTDAPGTKTIDWADTDLTRVLRFNFSRTINNPLNPVQITSADVDVNATSDYAQFLPGHDLTAKITGTNNGDASTSAAFYYGRTHAPRTRIAGGLGTATFYYEVYCFGTDANGTVCDPALRDAVSGGLLSVDDIRWFQNTIHNSADGNITSTGQKNGLANIAIGAPVNAAVSTVQYNYDGIRGYPYKTTMDINNSEWLLFNRFDPAATVNSFELEFNQAGMWSGTDLSGANVDSNASINTNRRIQW